MPLSAPFNFNVNNHCLYDDLTSLANILSHNVLWILAKPDIQQYNIYHQIGHTNLCDMVFP